MRKGFTLIELLAVIVILAIIALIAVPVILNIIESIKFGAYRVEENSLKKAAELYMATNNMTKLEGELDLTLLVSSGFINEVSDTGNGGICEGKVIMYNKNLKGCLNCSNYTTKNCGYAEEVTDENPGIICGDGSTEDYANSNTCYIKSVEDLQELSVLVNSGNNFSEKTVELMTDLNLKSSKSYANANSIFYGDLNNDGTTNGLMTELTKADNYGFDSIGTSSTPFDGHFIGNMHTIKNLTIVNDTNYTGLFGYNTGIIEGLTLSNINVSGVAYTGGLVGYSNSGTIKGITIVNGNVEGTTDVGGIAGTIKTTSMSEVAYDGDVLGSSAVGGIVGSMNQTGNSIIGSLANVNVTAEQNLGGIVGFNNVANSIYGVVESGNIHATNTHATASSFYPSTSIYLLNDATYQLGTNEATPASNIVISDNEKINFYDLFMDTWIGGDNNSSGYYFDYNQLGKIAIKSTAIDEIPETPTLSGQGTQEDPYLINSEEEWKQASLYPGSGYYFRLEENLDFTDNHYYALGSNYIGTTNNYYKNKLNGNGHSLNNISVVGQNNTGAITGYNSGGTIEDLTLNNINVRGNLNVGGLVGYSNTGTIRGITLNNVNVNSTANYAGGLIGYSKNVTIRGITITNGNVQSVSRAGGIFGAIYADKAYSTSYTMAFSGNVTATDSHAGGISSMLLQNSSLMGVLSNANVTGSSNVGSIAGSYSLSNSIYGIVESGSIHVTNPSGTIMSLNETTARTLVGVTQQISTNSPTSIGTVEQSNYNNLESYAGLTNYFYTRNSGGTNLSGYCFDYNSGGTDIIVTKLSAT